MKRSLRVIATAVLVSGGLHTATDPSLIARAAAASTPVMSVKVLSSSGPHTIGPKTLVTFHLRVRGMVLDPKHIGKQPMPGHGHIQIYLDRIPGDATSRRDMRGIVAVAGAANFSIGFTRPWLRLHAGHHRFLIALARNNDILYTGRPAAFSVTVR